MSEGSSKKTLFIVLGVLALLGLAGCCVMGLLVLEWGQQTAETARQGVARAEAYQGRPIAECHDAAHEEVRACGRDISCASGGQMMLRRCLQIAEVPPGYCDRGASTAEVRCRERCAGDPSQFDCAFACGQLETVIDQHCQH